MSRPIVVSVDAMISTYGNDAVELKLISRFEGKLYDNETAVVKRDEWESLINSCIDTSPDATINLIRTGIETLTKVKDTTK